MVDPVQRLSWTLDEAELTPPANTHEEKPAGELLRRVLGEYAWLHAATAAGDAGLGYTPFLKVAYELGVRRVVDLRADSRTDHDKDAWAIRGYDDKGWPICQLGYRLHPNGYDPERRRMKWCCRQACEAPPDPGGSLATCPPECPYRVRQEHPFGRIINVGETFADGSLRLARDVPYGSGAWKELYRRGRNAAEGRNAKLESWDLKRLPVFGQPRGQATIFLADLWGNLLQLARLIKEATLAKMAQVTQAS